MFGDYSSILPQSPTDVGLADHHNNIMYQTNTASRKFDTIYNFTVSYQLSKGDWVASAQGVLVEDADFSVTAYQIDCGQFLSKDPGETITNANGLYASDAPIDAFRNTCYEMVTNDTGVKYKNPFTQAEENYSLKAIRNECESRVLPNSFSSYTDKEGNSHSDKYTIDDIANISECINLFIRAIRDSLKKTVYDMSLPSFTYRQFFNGNITPMVGDTIDYSRVGNIYVRSDNNDAYKYTADQLPVKARCLPLTKDPVANGYHSLIDEPYNLSGPQWTYDSTNWTRTPDTAPFLSSGISATWYKFTPSGSSANVTDPYLTCTIPVSNLEGDYYLVFYTKGYQDQIKITDQSGNNVSHRYDSISPSSTGWTRKRIKTTLNTSITTLYIKFYALISSDTNDRSVADVHLDNVSGTYQASVTGEFPTSTRISKTTNIPSLINDFTLSASFFTNTPGQDTFTIFDIRDSLSYNLLKLKRTSNNLILEISDNMVLSLDISSYDTKDCYLVSVSGKKVRSYSNDMMYTIGFNDDAKSSTTVITSVSSSSPKKITFFNRSEGGEGFEGGITNLSMMDEYVHHYCLKEFI